MIAARNAAPPRSGIRVVARLDTGEGNPADHLPGPVLFWRHPRGDEQCGDRIIVHGAAVPRLCRPPGGAAQDAAAGSTPQGRTQRGTEQAAWPAIDRRLVRQTRTQAADTLSEQPGRNGAESCRNLMAAVVFGRHFRMLRSPIIHEENGNLGNIWDVVEVAAKLCHPQEITPLLVESSRN
jgi:hypothetical protein